jgi:hypothetical protein
MFGGKNKDEDEEPVEGDDGGKAGAASTEKDAGKKEGFVKFNLILFIKYVVY